MFTIDYSSELTLQTTENSNATVKLSGTLTTVASGGVYRLTNFAISADPGSIVELAVFSNEINTGNSDDGDNSDYVTTIPLVTTMRL